MQIEQLDGKLLAEYESVLQQLMAAELAQDAALMHVLQQRAEALSLQLEHLELELQKFEDS